MFRPDQLNLFAVIDMQLLKPGPDDLKMSFFDFVFKKIFKKCPYKSDSETEASGILLCIHAHIFAEDTKRGSHVFYCFENKLETKPLVLQCCESNLLSP